MQLEWRTLDGKQDRERFVEEWANSGGDGDATFVQTRDATYYLAPYGTYDYDTARNWKRYEKWESPFRSHGHVVSDFGLRVQDIVGGGYLKLAKDRKSCRYDGHSEDYGPATNTDELISKITEELLR